SSPAKCRTPCRAALGFQGTAPQQPAPQSRPFDRLRRGPVSRSLHTDLSSKGGPFGYAHESLHGERKRGVGSGVGPNVESPGRGRDCLVSYTVASPHFLHMDGQDPVPKPILAAPPSP